MEDHIDSFKAEIINILEGNISQSNGPAKKVFQVCLTTLSRKTKHVTSTADLDSIPFTKPIKEMLAVEVRVREERRKKKKKILNSF